jgi:hypothetical protein
MRVFKDGTALGFADGESDDLPDGVKDCAAILVESVSYDVRMSTYIVAVT